jgi:hypothetical protein
LVLVSAALPPKPAPTISFFWAATAANGRLFAGSIVAVALSSVSGQLQSPGLRSGNGKMARFLAAMPPKTYTFSLWRGFAAPHAAAKGDFAVALSSVYHGATMHKESVKIVGSYRQRSRLTHSENDDQ